MAELYTCPQCGGTFFVEPGEEAACTKCNAKLIATCEWCDKPEKECNCGKDEIKVEE